MASVFEINVDSLTDFVCLYFNLRLKSEFYNL